MDPELNDEPQLRSELSAEEQAASDKGAADAFRLAFGGDTDEQPGSAAQAPAAPPAAAPAPASSTAAAPAPNTGESRQEDDDPFKDLSPKARELLAEVPTLRRNFDALQGRLAPTQRKLAEVERENAELRRRLDSGAPAPSPAGSPPAANAPSAALERVRGELPEVAEAIEEMLARVPTASPPPPAPAPATTAQGGDEAAIDAAGQSLARVHPDWIPTMNSDGYKLWLAGQDRATQDELMSTNDPVIVADALTKFKGHKRRGDDLARESADVNARRENRTQRAVAPGRGAPPPGDTAVMSEHDAMVAAFNSP